jgi:hypothetical protein
MQQGRDCDEHFDDEQGDWAAAIGEIMDEPGAEGADEGEASDDEGDDDGLQSAGDGVIVVAEPPEEAMLVAAIDECKDEVGPRLPAELPPPPPIDDDLARVPASAGNRRLSVGLGKSYLAFYDRPQQFYAVCMHADHARCRLTRARKPNRTNMAAGRPLGYLMAWLADAHMYASAEEHRQGCFPSVADRRAGRLQLHELEESDEMFELERPQRADTGSEPEGLA